MDLQNILIRMIKSIDLFKEISDQEVIDLAKDFHLEFYSQDSKIIGAGTKPNKIYLLKKGRLEASRGSTQLGEISPGEIFGEMSYLKETNAMASVIALEDSDIWEIPVDKFGYFLRKYPHIRDSVLSIMYKRDQQNKDKVVYKDKLDGNKDFKVLL